MQQFLKNDPIFGVFGPVIFSVLSQGGPQSLAGWWLRLPFGMEYTRCSSVQGKHATQLGSPTILYGPQLSLTFGHVHPLFKKTHGFPMVAPTLLTAFSQRLGHVAMLLNRFFKSVATFFIATFLRCFVQSLRRVGVGGQRAMSPCLNCHLSIKERKKTLDWQHKASYDLKW